jgi:hypothetical protein
MAGKKGAQRRAWTPEDVARLRELAGKVPPAEIARELGRTEKAVGWRASALGLSLQVQRA